MAPRVWGVRIDKKDLNTITKLIFEEWLEIYLSKENENCGKRFCQNITMEKQFSYK